MRVLLWVKGEQLAVDGVTQIRYAYKDSVSVGPRVLVGGKITTSNVSIPHPRFHHFPSNKAQNEFLQ